jgi:tetratricopeptide (TPR) repeat protein
MQNPYEVLGLGEGASLEEVKRAYRELVKKYHPDQYANNPLKDLAEEKLREVNEAYRMIMEGAAGSDFGSGSGHGGFGGHSGDFNGNSGQNGGYGEEESLFVQAMDALNANDLMRAEYILNKINNRDARWYYLMGHVNYRRSRFGDAYDCFKTAVNMDPGNMEYQQALNNMISMRNNYQQNVYYSTRRDSDDCCQALCALWACDTCCECMGGDLCTCC